MSINYLNSPIILIGTHRSGTSWLFKQVFSTHPDLAGWKEPRYVWEWGNNYKQNDVLTAEDARPEVIEHIRNRFAKFVQDQGKKRLFEKTPSNCLRIPFINKIYPEAKIIHIIRDGRANFASLADMMEGNFYRQDFLNSRLVEMIRETPLIGIPAYFPLITDTIASKLLKRPNKSWGPRPEGWQEWAKKDSKNILLAKRWAATMYQCIEDVKQTNPKYYYRFRYEDLIAQPQKIMSEIVDFTELEGGQQIVADVVKTVDPSRQERWRSKISSETLAEVKPYLQPALERLGYSW